MGVVSIETRLAFVSYWLILSECYYKCFHHNLDHYAVT